MTCPLCNGAGKKMVIVRHSQSRLAKVVIDWCLCMKSKFVSENPAYNKLLKRLKSSEDYLSFDKIDPQLKFIPENLSESPNLLIRSDPESLFFLNLKTIIMKHRFNDPAPLFLCCTSTDLLKDYYIQQNDGSNPQLSDTNKFDLLVFTLDNREKNDQLKTCVAQVIYNRLSIKKPTWVYINKPALSLCTFEYSEELEEHLKKYESVMLEEKNENKESAKVQEDASNFMRTNDPSVAETTPRKKQKMRRD
jgi:hypothetical protein